MAMKLEMSNPVLTFLDASKVKKGSINATLTYGKCVHELVGNADALLNTAFLCHPFSETAYRITYVGTMLEANIAAKMADIYGDRRTRTTVTRLTRAFASPTATTGSNS